MSPRARGARRRWAAPAALLGVVLGTGCATYADAIERGQRYYEDNQYERALALWRDLDRRGAELAPRERARFAYFRGMTDYRLGFREEARHWLAVARAHEMAARGALLPVWLQRLDGALEDLERGGPRSRSNDVVQTIEAPPDVLPPEPVTEPGSAADPSPSGTVEPVAEPPARPAPEAPDVRAPEPRRR